MRMLIFGRLMIIVISASLFACGGNGTGGNTGTDRTVSDSSPTIFFSDLTDAPISGWNQTTTQGAVVTIWGKNLGTNRGNSTVSVGGITLSDDDNFAEWGETTNPTTARGLQRIAFWLNSSMVPGESTIRVTTSDGVSNNIPF